MGRNSKDNSMEKRKMVQNISREYFVCLRNQSLKNFHLTLNEGGQRKGKSLKEICEYIAKVEYAFARLDVVDKTIINNDFFYSDDQYWWVNVYPQSTYYRLKVLAVSRFLESWDLVNKEC
ncbi:MAG: hypothetical protein MJ248_01950 [Bacilli bacterium]|nr:hypothetical protein [Bacilli bacterium]